MVLFQFSSKTIIKSKKTTEPHILYLILHVGNVLLCTRMGEIMT